MPTVRVPLVGSFNQRGLEAEGALTLYEDQRFKNCVFSVANNPVTGKATAYVEKRPGWVQDSIPASGSPSTGMIIPHTFNASMSAFGDTNSTIYWGTTSVGDITGRAVSFDEALISGVSYVAIKSSDGTGWYYVDGAKDDLTYVGDTHNGTAVIDSLDNTTGVYVGQAWAGTGVGADARVLTVDSATQVTLTVNSTADGTDISFTKTPIAKILDTDFTTTGNPNGKFVHMDGFMFYTDGSNIRNSDLNSITSYSASSYKAVDMEPDGVVGIARSKNLVTVFGTASLQPFQNAGYATGSPLERVAQGFSRIGAQSQMSITALENDVFFLGSADYGDVQAWRLRDNTPQKISTPFVDKILGTNSTNGTNYASAFRLGGYPYAIFTISTAHESNSNLLLESGDFMLLEDGDNILLEGNPSSTASFSRQLVYNADINVWSEWTCSVATFITAHGPGGASYNNMFATSRFGTTGKIYRLSPVIDGNIYSDDGTAYDMEIRTSKLDHGTAKRKFIPEIRLIADNQDSGTVTLEASDDDYGSWRTLGTFDLTKDDKRITRCGSYKGGRAYRLTHSTATPFRAEALEIDYRT